MVRNLIKTLGTEPHGIFIVLEPAACFDLHPFCVGPLIAGITPYFFLFQC